MKKKSNTLNNILAKHDYQQRPIKRVLIVDDNVSFLSFARAAVDSPQTLTFVLSDPFEVIKTFVEINPDIVFLDINMPGLSGVELYQMLALINRFRSKIILMSANTIFTRELQASTNLNSATFLYKPISLNQFQEIVETPRS